MIDRPDGLRVALAHDWLVGLRGGELVLDQLAARFGPTTLYTLVADGRPLTQAIDGCTVVTSPLQMLPGGAGRMRRHYLPLMPWAVERLRVAPCDLLFSTSSAVMKSIIVPPGTVHLCYCHSPARYLWEQTTDYAVGRGGRLRRLGLAAFGPRLRAWDRRTADRVTHFIANSQHTANRIQRCYDRRATVIYPPVRTEFFTPDSSIAREPWFLVVSALEPYKRTDLVMAAAQRAGVALKIAGTGSQAGALRAAAPDNVEFLGHVDGDALRDLFRRARALVFPQVEDFGITAVEAQACGCPVIAFSAGGALETVTEETGSFFAEQSMESLSEALRSAAERTFDSAACRLNAERFSCAVFDDAIERVVDQYTA